MEQDDENTERLNSIVSRLILNIETSAQIHDVAKSAGIPDENYVDFLMGLIYCGSQTLFQKESGLDERVADDIFHNFWHGKGKEIRTRLLQNTQING